MSDTADPVADPGGYRALLLSYLGDDDPAEAQSATPRALRELVRDAGDRLRQRPADGEWSALECVGHIVDAEIVCSARYRWVLAHDRPPLLPYDQELWASRLRHVDADPDELLTMFEGLRAANVALWRRTSPEERARYGLHEERGQESFDVMFRMLGGHDRLHMEQARRALRSTS
jgi:DinB superfamily